MANNEQLVNAIADLTGDNNLTTQAYSKGEKMHFFRDVIRVLERKANLIDRPIQDDSQWVPAGVDIIETALWARSVLDVIAHVEFHRYGHRLKTNIRTTRSNSDPDHPGSAKAVYKHNENISLNELLGIIIHFRDLSVDRYADGNHCLNVMSDRNDRRRVCYSDFTAALRSLVLSKRLVALAICDIVEENLLQRHTIPWEDTDARSFADDTLDYLLYEHVKSETKLKLRIMEDIFGISDVPDEVLPSLAFFGNYILD